MESLQYEYILYNSDHERETRNLNGVSVIVVRYEWHMLKNTPACANLHKQWHF